MLDETKITKAIIETYTEKLLESLQSDVIIVGAGPSGLTAGYYLKKLKSRLKVILFERKLSIGGGMWGGGMMLNQIVVQEEGKKILDEFGIGYKSFEEGYYTADSIEAVTTLASFSVKTGLKIFNAISVEDVIVMNDKVNGVVINWTPSIDAGLHVDPLALRSKYIIDATGHPCEIARIIEKKGMKLFTDTGRIVGEGAMFADKAEAVIIKNTKEIFPNLWVCGMAANAVFGGPRMGPIFGGMLLSGKLVAERLMEKID